MRPSRARYQLWHVMLAIAVLAGLFAVFGVTSAFAMVVVIGVIFLPILLAPSGRRLEAAVWVSSVYPVLIVSSFYAPWLTAWCVLGRRPRAFTDDTGYLGPIVDGVRTAATYFLMGAPVIWFVCAPVTLAVVYWNMAQRRTPPWKGAAQLLIPVCAWLSIYAISRWDPCDVLTWYFD